MSLTAPPASRAPVPAPGDAAEETAADEAAAASRPAEVIRRLEPLAVVVLVALGVVLRFATTSELWLDEALSVNIASLPLGEIPDALRQDGHPPLYYVLLHGWMEVFGEGDIAVRALSGLVSVAALPFAWWAGQRLGGRRVAWLTLVLTATSPFALRYATEARMYALAILLVFAGYLAVIRALERPSAGRLALVAGLAAALFYTHYWAIWLLGSVLLIGAWAWRRARRTGDRTEARALARTGGALVAGGVAFLPWTGVLLYQAANTGTPWSVPVRPTALVTFTLADFGGGPEPEAVLVGLVLAFCLVLGLFGRRVDAHRVELDWRAVPPARVESGVVALTAVIGFVTGYLGNSTYNTRYGAVFFPLVMLVAAVGIDRITGRVPRTVLLGGLVALCLFSAGRGVVDQRTQAGEVATSITQVSQPGDLVAYCPDQLGPAGERALPEGLDQVTFPDLAPPERVNWVDYQARTDAADPVAVGGELVDRAGADQAIFVVYATGYRTHEGTCQALVEEILDQRIGGSMLDADGSFFEPAAVYWFPGAP